jgi:hypothetical protein
MATPVKSGSGRDTQQIFDLMAKLIIQEATPTALIHWINSLFKKDFPLDAPVWRSPTESVNDASGKLEKNTSDIMLNIAGHDFHIEVQIEDDETMALRVFEYGFARARDTKTISEDKSVITLRMPEARIIYLEPTASTPDIVTLRLIFPDEGSKKKQAFFDYPVKTFKLLDHSLDELEKQNMTLLVPLYSLKYRKTLKASQPGSEKRKALAADARELGLNMEQAVERSKERGILTNIDAVAALRHIIKMYNELYQQYPEFEEVRMELEERLKSHAAEDVAAAEMSVINKIENLHQQGVSYDQAVQRVKAETSQIQQQSARSQTIR